MLKTMGADDAPVLILSPNALEAADIGDFLLRRGCPGVITETRLNSASSPLNYLAHAPKLVFFAFPLNANESKDWVKSALAKDWQIILINGDNTDPDFQSLRMISRPFSSSQLEAALTDMDI